MQLNSSLTGCLRRLLGWLPLAATAGWLFLAAGCTEQEVTASASAGLLLVEDGQPRATIVVAEPQPASAHLATQALINYLERSSGARLEVVTVNEITTETLDPQANWIILGDTPFTRALGVNPEQMEYGQFTIRARENVLVIAGGDYPAGQAAPEEAYFENVVSEPGVELVTGWREQRINLDQAIPHYWNSGGTLYGVYHFLEDNLGIRWLWPGEIGTVIPSHHTVTIADQQIEQSPALKIRWQRNQGPSRLYESQQESTFGEIVIDPDRRLARYQQDEWWRANYQGKQRRFRANHAFNEWWDRFSEEHPEYFAYQHIGDSRKAEIVARRHINLCLSEPGVIDQFIEDAVAYLDANPHSWTVSASPGDAPTTGNCMCDDCRALDPADGQPVTLYDGDTREAFEHVSLTDRHVNWWNRIAERLAETHPDRYVAAWAYGPYRHPPVHEQLRDNIMIGFVGFNWVNGHALENDREYWQGWSRAAPQLLLRPNAFHAGLAFPLNYGRELAGDMLACYESGMFGAEFDSLIGHWSTQGINYYILARSMWNPELDFDAVMQDFCQAGFGPAGEAVLDYFTLLEAMSDEVRERVGAHSRGQATWALRAEEMLEQDIGAIPETADQAGPVDMESAPRWITRRVVPRESLTIIARVYLAHEEKLRNALAAAHQALGPDDQEYAARIDFLLTGLDYATLESQLLDQWYDAEPDELRAMLNKRNEFLRAIAGEFYLSVPRIIERHGRFGMNHSFYQNELRYRR